MNKFLPALEERVADYWAAYLGCTSPDLDSAQTRVIASSTHAGLVAFSKGTGWVVAVPSHWAPAMISALPAFFPCGQLPALHAIRHLLATSAAPDIYGPACIFLLPTPPPVIVQSATLRRLHDDDLSHVQAFKAEIGALAWSFGQGDGWLCAWGAFVEHRLVAVCAVRVWGELLAEIYIDTLPAYRNRGYGKAVTSATVAWVQHNTPYFVESVVEVDNESSLALMASLHFQPYGYLLLSDTAGMI